MLRGVDEGAKMRRIAMKALFLSLLIASATAALAEPIRFERREIAEFRAGYQLAVADVSGDGKPDVVALATETNRVDWFENPTWKPRPVAQTSKNIDLALHDMDGDGRLEIALASGFVFNDSKQNNQIQWLGRAATLEEPWQLHVIAADPVAHRLRWGDLDGDGRAELIHAPIVGPGSGGIRNSKPAHLWAFRVPPKPAAEPWKVWPIDESLTVLHGVWVGRFNKKDRRDEILTASAEGVYRFRFEGSATSGRWRKMLLTAGAPGASEVVPGKLGPGKKFIATIEPWHGNQAVVYLQPAKGGAWQRTVLDTTMKEGHALAVADFDGDGLDEVVFGWRAGGGGLFLFRATDATGQQFTKIEIERGVAAECAVAADMDGDGRLDLVVSAGRNNKILWYQNRQP
jgi:hypothetical protein